MNTQTKVHVVDNGRGGKIIIHHQKVIVCYPKTPQMELSNEIIEHVYRNGELQEQKIMQKCGNFLEKVTKVNILDRDYAKVSQYLKLKYKISRSLANTNGEIVNELNVVI